MGLGVGDGLGDGDGVGVAVGVGVGVGVGDESPSGDVVSAAPASTRYGTSPSILFDMRTTWSTISLLDRYGKFARTSATSPATIGAAIDVPLHVAY